METPPISQTRQNRNVALWVSLLLIIIHILQHCYPSMTTTLSLHPLPISAPSATVSSVSPLVSLLLYPLLHLNPFHLLANLWTFLLIVWHWNVTPSLILRSYIISVMFGFLLLLSRIPFSPIIGFSAPIYALLATRAASGSLKQIICYNSILITTILLTGLIPRVSILAHLSCYLLSSLLSILTTPIIKKT